LYVLYNRIVKGPMKTKTKKDQPEALEHSACKSMLRPVRDALDVLNGKWKLPIIVALTFGEKRFGEISKEVHGITDRVLSKELQDLCMNGLVKRTVEDTFPVKVTYALTPHSISLGKVIESLRDWGLYHREYIRKEVPRV
jgi:DNA-binding HxlR family transcriptional regulator